MDTIRIRLKDSHPPDYSEAFKSQIVDEFEKEVLNKMPLQDKQGIGRKSRVLSWYRKPPF